MEAGPQDRDALWAGWMAAAQAGDRGSYERLLHACTPFIRRIVARRGLAPDRVDDVVQEVLLTVHRARQTYDPGRSFSAWLQTIAQRRTIDALRRNGRRDRREVYAPADYENHADVSSDIDRSRPLDPQGTDIAAALDALPPGQREAVETLAVRQLSLSEAAGVTGKTKGALKVNMHRALKSLRARFEGLS